MTLTYWELFLIDAAIWLACLALLLRRGRLTALHPGSLYLLYHAYTHTYRLFQLANGAPTLFEGWRTYYHPVTLPEIQRASLLAMGALLTTTAVWLYLAKREPVQQVPPCRDTRFRPFSRRVMWLVLVITLPVGLVALVALRGPVLSAGSTVSLGAWSESGYLTSMYQWFGISLLGLCYCYGFPCVLVIPLLAYLAVALLTFPFRMMTIVPLLFLVFVYLRRNNLRWPNPRLAIPIVAIALLFIAGKELGPILRSSGLGAAGSLVAERVSEMQAGTHLDQTFLDQFAMALTQVNEHGHFFYGRTYLGLLVFPIPRALWPGKPGLADWQWEIQTFWRPTAELGAIVTMLGEAYANFGYVGVFLYSVILARLMYSLYRWMSRAPYYSLANFWALCVYAILIQVLRDGLVSFVSFQATVLMPLTAITLLHLLLLRRYRRNGAAIGWTTALHGPDELIGARGESRRIIPAWQRG